MYQTSQSSFFLYIIKNTFERMVLARNIGMLGKCAGKENML